jgi:hypothetical protein
MKPSRPGHNPLAHRVAGSFFALLLIAGLVGCAKATRISTSAAGHEIDLVVSGNHSIESNPVQGVIKSPHGTVTIETNRVRVDNNAWTTIPVRIPVEVHISKGRVLLTAGNVTVKRTVN